MSFQTKRDLACQGWPREQQPQERRVLWISKQEGISRIPQGKQKRKAVIASGPEWHTYARQQQRPWGKTPHSEKPHWFHLLHALHSFLLQAVLEMSCPSPPPPNQASWFLACWKLPGAIWTLGLCFHYLPIKTHPSSYLDLSEWLANQFCITELRWTHKDFKCSFPSCPVGLD